MRRALIRSIANTFQHALTMRPREAPIDVERARRQHHEYAAALSRAGAEIVELPADDTFPDGCFVEDCALVADGVALITRPGASSRRGEIHAVWRALERFVRIELTSEPATLDGGDCMRAGKRIYVGRSQRTNEAGIARVREVFGPLGYDIVAIPLHDVLHLKCVCSPLDQETILLADGTLPRELFRGLRILSVPANEECAANAVAIGRTALVAAGHKVTERVVAEHGLDVIPLDTSEIRKADGALTCLSVLLH
jgi:dimethylargininase